MTTEIYEIRDYTIDPEWFDRYATWARTLAAPWLKKNLDVIDFWLDEGQPPETSGSNPVVSSNGQANVTWIIRWASQETREKDFPETMSSKEWKEIWSKHPNENAYLHTNVRFMKSA
jgi:hypothetical protein